MRALLAALLCLSFPANANAVEVICPLSIEVKQEIISTHSGFAAYNPNHKHYSSSITLYDGPPEEMASLKPENGDEVSKIYKYELTPKANNFWVLCNYAFTNVSLKFQIKEAVSHCETIESNDATSYKMVCK